MRRWRHSPAPLLRLTAPSSPCREVPWEVLAPLTPITTTTVTPALPIWAPGQVPWPPPRALTTTRAAPASRALSPPPAAPPSLSRWQTKHTTAATSPRPVRRGATALSCRGVWPTSPRHHPRRHRHKFHPMSYPQWLLTSYPYRDGPQVAAKGSHPWLRHSLFLYTLVPHTPLVSLFLLSFCCPPSLPVRSILASSQTRSEPWPSRKSKKKRPRCAARSPDPLCFPRSKLSSPQMWPFSCIATTKRSTKKKRRRRKKTTTRRTTSGIGGSRATRASRCAAATWRERSERKRNCRRGHLVKEGKRLWRRRRGQTCCTTAWTVPSERRSPLSRRSWTTPRPPASSRRQARPSSLWSPRKLTARAM